MPYTIFNSAAYAYVLSDTFLPQEDIFKRFQYGDLFISR